jgi:trimethylamine:corrinoid methyltransferase-like protein
MRSLFRFKSQCVPDYRLLTEEQIGEIHGATLDLLHNTGVKVLNEEAQTLLKDAGCRIEAEHIVKIPGWLVEESIRCAPSSVTVYNRQGDATMVLGGTNVCFGMGTDLLNTWDLRTGELRPSCLQDVIHEVGPGGNFLAHNQTLKYCREEHWTPHCINRQSPEMWQKMGGRRYREVVVEKALDILSTHKPDRLIDEEIKRLDEIMDKSAKRLKGEQLSV